MCKHLEEVLKDIREELAKTAAALALSEGRNATQEAQLSELERKEKAAQLEIQNLLGQLSQAKIDIDAVKQKVNIANAHAKTYWDTLQNIRVDGGWLLRTDEKDDCDETLFVMQPVCEFQTSKPLEITNTVTVMPETPSN